MAICVRNVLPAQTPCSKVGLDLFDEQRSAHGDALRPSPFLNPLFNSQSLFNPASMGKAQLIAVADIKQLHQCLSVNSAGIDRSGAFWITP